MDMAKKAKDPKVEEVPSGKSVVTELKTEEVLDSAVPSSDSGTTESKIDEPPHTEFVNISNADTVTFGLPFTRTSDPVIPQGVNEENMYGIGIQKESREVVVLEPGRRIGRESFHDDRARYISALDEPEYSNQHHYVLEVQETDPGLGVVKKVHREDIRFQKGSLASTPPNGWIESDLVLILIDRLTNFSKEGVSQPENEEALKGLRAAYAALDKRRKRKIDECKKSTASKKNAPAIKPVIY